MNSWAQLAGSENRLIAFAGSPEMARPQENERPDSEAHRAPQDVAKYERERREKVADRQVAEARDKNDDQQRIQELEQKMESSSSAQEVTKAMQELARDGAFFQQLRTGSPVSQEAREILQNRLVAAMEQAASALVDLLRDRSRNAEDRVVQDLLGAMNAVLGEVMNVDRGGWADLLVYLANAIRDGNVGYTFRSQPPFPLALVTAP